MEFSTPGHDHRCCRSSKEWRRKCVHRHTPRVEEEFDQRRSRHHRGGSRHSHKRKPDLQNICQSYNKLACHYEREDKRRCYGNEEDEEEVEAIMDHLPWEIVLDILAKLPLRCCLRFRSVSKSWSYLIDDPQFRELQVSNVCQRQHEQQEHNCFILAIAPNHYYDEYSSSNIYTVDKQKNWCKEATLLPLDDELQNLCLKIYGTCNGLVCLRNRSRWSGKGIIVSNPVTKESITLPDLDLSGLLELDACIGFDAASNKYKVVAMVFLKGYGNMGRYCSDGYVITLGGGELFWRDFHLPCEFELKRNAVYFKGAFYWMTPDHLLVMDCDDKFRVVRYMDDYNSNLQGSWYVADLGKYLAMIETDWQHGLIQIWELQQVDRRELGTWKHRSSIDTSSLFVNNESLFVNNEWIIYRVTGAFDNGSFMLMVSKPSSRSRREWHYGMAVYTPAKRGRNNNPRPRVEFVTRIGNGERWVDVFPFNPSFVSPYQLLLT